MQAPVLLGWSNKRVGKDHIRERLDRAIASTDWVAQFPVSNLRSFHSTASDHRALVLHLFTIPNSGFKPFQFFQMWTFDPTLPQVVRDAWSKPITFETQAQYPKTLRKFSTLRNDLRKWNQLHFGNVIHTSKKLLEELDHLSNLPITDENTLKLREILKSLEELRVKEESYWKHKSRCDKIKLGDHNQKYFHASTMVRRKNHFLARKKDSNDSFFTDSHEVGNSFTEYFEELFSSTNPSPDHNIESLFHPCVDPTDNEFLVAVPDEEDIWSTVKSIGNWIAPGPDGFQAFFYQKYWDVIKPDIVATIQEMFTSRYVPQAMNLTHIALIPKIKNPTTHTHYRPISLCNVI